jgi:hypothetical protein
MILKSCEEVLWGSKFHVGTNEFAIKSGLEKACYSSYKVRTGDDLIR